MQYLILFIVLAAIFQVGVLLFGWFNHKHPLSALKRLERVHVVTAILKARDHVKDIDVFARSLLGGEYGDMTLSQIEFLHQMSKSCKKAAHELDSLLDTQRRSGDATLGSIESKSDKHESRKKRA